MMMIINANRERDSGVLHHIDFDLVTCRMLKTRLRFFLNDERKIPWRDGDQHLVFFPDIDRGGNGPFFKIFDPGPRLIWI